MAPAVPAPCVLGSLGDGAELPVVTPVPSFFMAGPPPVVLPSMLPPVVVCEAAGPPASELPPALLPVCAKAAVEASAAAAAREMTFIFMAVSCFAHPGK
jgi:hypothetical protein